MMKRLVAPSLAMMTVVANGLAIAPAAIAQTTPKIISTAMYKCDDGKGFKAQFRDDRTMVATFGSQVFELGNIESASGAKYGNGSITVSTKGDTAFVDVGDQRLFSNCVATGKVSGLW